jgi:hypothetical protein
VWALSYGDMSGTTVWHWDGQTWSTSPLPPGGGAAGGYALGGSGPSDVWAVGDKGNIAHWDGCAWSALPIADGGGVNLHAVWADSPADAWAVGDTGTTLHWDGKVWSPTWSNATTSDLRGVWGSGPGDVWAVGFMTVLHNGIVATPAILSDKDYLTRVWGSGPADVWVADDADTLYHWDGVLWTKHALSTGVTSQDSRVGAGWADAPTDSWFAGGGSTLMHWDGKSWSNVCPAGAALGSTLTGVWGSGASDVWSWGSGGVVHWDGTSWSAAGNSPSLRWGDAPNDVWGATTTSIDHWDGTQWWGTGLYTTGDDINGLWGSGPNLAYGVECDSFVDMYGNPYKHSWVFLYDGSTWTAENGGNLCLYAVWGSGPTDVWVSGAAGTMYHYGNQVQSPSPPVGWDIYGIWGSGPNDTWAVGDGGIVHWDGTAWSIAYTGTGQLRSIWGSASNDVWAVGLAGGIAYGDGVGIVHWDGSAWTPSASGAGQALRGVWGSKPGGVWAVGDFGTILHHP